MFLMVGIMALVLTTSARSAGAQICSGGVSFNLASTHFDLHAGVDRGGRGLGASVGHGRDMLFGVASAAIYDVDNADQARMIAGTVGTDQPLSPDNRFRVCPTITVAYVSGADGASADGGRVGISVAGDVSMLAVNTPRLWVVPTIGLDIRYNAAGRAAVPFAQGGASRYTTFTAGMGFVISNRLSLVPRVAFPVRSIDRTGFQVTVGYNRLRR